MIKLSVSEYAEKNSISVQAVYKKISKLNTVEEERNGRKQVFILVDDIQPNSTVVVKPDSTEEPTENKGFSADELNHIQPNSTVVVKPDSTVDFAAVIEMLRAQVAEKDKQIERLQNAADEKDKQIQDQFERLTALLLRSQELEAIAQKMLLGQGETTEENAVGADEAEADKIEVSEVKSAEEQPKKESILNRIFKRKAR